MSLASSNLKTFSKGSQKMLIRHPKKRGSNRLWKGCLRLNIHRLFSGNNQRESMYIKMDLNFSESDQELMIYQNLGFNNRVKIKTISRLLTLSVDLQSTQILILVSTIKLQILIQRNQRKVQIKHPWKGCKNKSHNRMHQISSTLQSHQSIWEQLKKKLNNASQSQSKLMIKINPKVNCL